MPLPKPTGIFGVGCVDIMTKASVIPEDIHPKVLCSTDLGSFVRLYYPCKQSIDNPELRKATWLPEPNQSLYSYALSSYVKMGNVVGWMVQLLYGNVRMDAIRNAPLIDQASWKERQVCPVRKSSDKLPLIVFSHGIGSQRAIYSVFCNQLASEGFLVAAIEHRDRSGSTTFLLDVKGHPVELPYYHVTSGTKEEKEESMKLRNVQLEKRTEEVTAALDLLEKIDTTPEDVHNCIQSDNDLSCFKGRIDMTYPIMMGHSFGAATTVNALRKEPRLKCGFGLDVWFEPFKEEFFSPRIDEERKPMFMIFTEYFNFKYNMKRCYNLIKNYARDYIEIVTLRYTRHYDQCDVPGILPSFVNNYFLKKHDKSLPYDDAIAAQRKLISDYCWKCLQKKGLSEPINLLNDDYVLDDVFMVGSPIEDK